MKRQHCVRNVKRFLQRQFSTWRRKKAINRGPLKMETHCRQDRLYLLFVVCVFLVPSFLDPTRGNSVTARWFGLWWGATARHGRPHSPHLPELPFRESQHEPRLPFSMWLGCCQPVYLWDSAFASPTALGFCYLSTWIINTSMNGYTSSKHKDS